MKAAATPDRWTRRSASMLPRTRPPPAAARWRRACAARPTSPASGCSATWPSWPPPAGWRRRSTRGAVPAAAGRPRAGRGRGHDRRRGAQPRLRRGPRRGLAGGPGRAGRAALRPPDQRRPAAGRPARARPMRWRPGSATAGSRRARRAPDRGPAGHDRVSGVRPLEPPPGYRPSAVGEAALERVRAFLADEALPMVEEVEGELGDTAFALEADGRLADADDRAQARDAAGLGAGRPLLPAPARGRTGASACRLVDTFYLQEEVYRHGLRGAQWMLAWTDGPSHLVRHWSAEAREARPAGLPRRPHERRLRADRAGRRQRRARARVNRPPRRRRLGAQRDQAPHHRRPVRRARPGPRARRGRRAARADGLPGADGRARGRPRPGAADDHGRRPDRGAGVPTTSACPRAP